MKTAMQELQDALEIYSRHNNGTPEGKAIDITLSAFPKFIEAEKEQIKDAFNQGYREGMSDSESGVVMKGKEDVAIFDDAKNYYSQTFKSDE